MRSFLLSLLHFYSLYDKFREISRTTLNFFANYLIFCMLLGYTIAISQWSYYYYIHKKPQNIALFGVFLAPLCCYLFQLFQQVSQFFKVTRIHP